MQLRLCSKISKQPRKKRLRAKRELLKIKKRGFLKAVSEKSEVMYVEYVVELFFCYGFGLQTVSRTTNYEKQEFGQT